MLVSDDVTIRLTRIEDKLDASLETLKDHEARLRHTENKIWVGAGGGAIITGLLGTLTYHVFGH